MHPYGVEGILLGCGSITSCNMPEFVAQGTLCFGHGVPSCGSGALAYMRQPEAVPPQAL